MDVGIGKRSAQRDKTKLPEEKIVHNDLNPIPFDFLEHGPHLRSRRQASCGDQSVQHVLFVLDTSGSIGPTQFNRMKNAIAKLVPLFCKQVKIAIVSFDHQVNLEFCFNCFGNTEVMQKLL